MPVGAIEIDNATLGCESVVKFFRTSAVEYVWRYTLKGAIAFYAIGAWARPFRRFLRSIGLVRA